MSNRTFFRSNDMRKTTSRTVALVLVLVSFSPASGDLQQWEFESDSDLHQWVPNSHLSNVVVKDGILRADAADWDPMIFHSRLPVLLIESSSSAAGFADYTPKTVFLCRP